MDTSAKRLADDLQDALEGRALLVDILARATAQEYGDAINACFADLHHFLADDTIRAKDPWYKEMQEFEMRKLILYLRSGAAPERIRKITFLSYSDD